MKYSGSFDYDLEFGESAEDWVSSIFTGGSKIEVKYDRIAHDTGRIFIEYESRGKPSGIATTSADYWIYKLEYTGSALILEIKFLKEKLREYYKERRYLKMGGDENTSKGFLVPIKEIMKP